MPKFLGQHRHAETAQARSSTDPACGDGAGGLAMSWSPVVPKFAMPGATVLVPDVGAVVSAGGETGIFADVKIGETAVISCRG